MEYLQAPHPDKPATLRPNRFHVVCAWSNPMRFASRLTRYKEFEQHMVESGVQLHTVELAHGHHDWQLHGNPGVDYIQVRSKTLLWHKENLLNIGFMHVPHTALGIGWFDADIRFRDPNWAIKTLEALQHYEVVQPWSDALDIGPCGEILKHHKSFAAQFISGEPMGNVMGGKYTFAHPGYAWAARRSALDGVGGLIERAILGAADHHMALAIIGKAENSIKQGVTDAYRRMIMDWQARSLDVMGMNLGVVQGSAIEHGWHGRKEDRKYVDRWQIIIRNQFDPNYDLYKNTNGVLELTRRKPRLRMDIDQYFRQRNEDGNVL